jgi:hypothetical protein
MDRRILGNGLDAGGGDLETAGDRPWGAAGPPKGRERIEQPETRDTSRCGGTATQELPS